MRYWLFKSEPDEFGMDDLEAPGTAPELREGIRNCQARKVRSGFFEVC